MKERLIEISDELRKIADQLNEVNSPQLKLANTSLAELVQKAWQQTQSVTSLLQNVQYHLNKGAES